MILHASIYGYTLIYANIISSYDLIDAETQKKKVMGGEINAKAPLRLRSGAAEAQREYER
jgi:hypothetical protein